jgi:nicotinamidase/pyrazinamidase
MKSPPLFWDVDTQVDFMLPGGSLYVPGAEQIIPNLERLTQHASHHGIPILSSMDAHRPDDPEFSQYPPHCIAGTPGQKKIAATLLQNYIVLPSRPVSLPDSLRYQQIIVEKENLDLFTNPNIDALLERLGPRDIVLYGVVTEICVERAARGLLERGYPVCVVTDAIRAFDESQARKCLSEIERRGSILTNTEEIVHRQLSPALIS